MDKNLPANPGERKDAALIPGSGKSPGEGHGNPFQYSCLEKPMDREAWQATVHKVTKSQAQLKQRSTHTRTHEGLKTIKLYSGNIKNLKVGGAKMAEE